MHRVAEVERLRASVTRASMFGLERRGTSPRTRAATCILASCNCQTDSSRTATRCSTKAVVQRRETHRARTTAAVAWVPSITHRTSTTAQGMNMAVDADVRLVCNFKSQGVPGPEARRRAVRRRSARCTDGRRPVSSGDRARRKGKQALTVLYFKEL